MSSRNFPKKLQSTSNVPSNHELVVSRDLCLYLESVSQIPQNKFDADCVGRLVEECSVYVELLFIRSDTSRYLEQIFGNHPSTALPILQQLLALKRKKLFSLLVHRNASHATESLLEAIVTSEEDLADLKQLVNIFAEEWSSLCADTYSSFVLRCCARLLAGISKEQLKIGAKNSAKVDPQKLSMLSTLLERALSWNIFKDFVHYEASGMLIQDFITIDLMACNGKYLKKMLTCCFDDQIGVSQICQQMCSKCGSRVWDTVIEKCCEDELEMLYNLAMQGQLPKLALHNFANFPIQKLIKRCKTEEMATNVFDELIPVLHDILAANKLGVITCMLNVASVIKPVSKSLIKSLLKYFNCSKPKIRQTSFAVCLICVKSYEDVGVQDDTSFLDTNSVSYHGSMFAQTLLYQFDKGCKKLVHSVLSLPVQALQVLACHANASHVLDAFFKSEKVEHFHKELLFEKIGASWACIACDKYGSRVLDTVWTTLSMKYKCALAQHLNKTLQTLLRNQFGRIVAKKYLIEQYSKKKETKWRNDVMAGLKKFSAKTGDQQGMKRKFEKNFGDKMNSKKKKIN